MGYGAKENPVPWLGPQQWIKEVHWPNNREIRIDVAIGFTSSGTGPTGSGGPSFPPVTHLGQGYNEGDLLHWPPPPQPPWPPYPPPKILNGRQAQEGDGNPFDLDAISQDNITFTGMPNLPSSAQISYGVYQIFLTGIHPIEPIGSFTKFRATDDQSKRFREGTDLKFKLWGIPFTGPFGSYGGSSGRPLAGSPSWPSSYTSDMGQFTIDFSGTIFKTKGKDYKPHARYMAGPFDKTQFAARPGGFSFSLLCKAQKTNPQSP